MPNAIHHHQALQAATQVAAAGHSAWLDALPPWAQTPFFLTFAPCFIVLVLLMIRHRVNLHRRGEKLTNSKTTPAGYVGLFLVGGAFFYLRDKFPIIPLIFEWPDRTFPYYRAHGFVMWLGFLAAGLVARMISALFAALFLRGSGSRGGRGLGVGITAGRHTLLPDPPAGYGWFSPPQTTQRITRQRTYHIEEE